MPKDARIIKLGKRFMAYDTPLSVLFYTMKKPLFLAGLTVSLAAVAILNQGCATNNLPQNLVWYGPNKSALQANMDAAECRNLVRVNEGSIPIGAGGLVAAMAIVGNNDRDNSIYQDCMVSKGYYLIKTNELALLNETQKREVPADSAANIKAATDVIGQWRCSNSHQIKRDESGISEIDFYSGSQVALTTVKENKSIQIPGTYYVIGDILVMYLATSPAPLIAAQPFTLSGESLAITVKNGRIINFTNSASISH
jgi:hypothetical protein